MKRNGILGYFSNTLRQFVNRELENRTKKSRKVGEIEPEQPKSIGKSRESRDRDRDRDRDQEPRESRRERGYSGEISGEFGMRADGQSIDAYYGEGRQGLGMVNEDVIIFVCKKWG